MGFEHNKTHVIFMSIQSSLVLSWRVNLCDNLIFPSDNSNCRNKLNIGCKCGKVCEGNQCTVIAKYSIASHHLRVWLYFVFRPFTFVLHVSYFWNAKNTFIKKILTCCNMLIIFAIKIFGDGSWHVKMLNISFKHINIIFIDCNVWAFRVFLIKASQFS